MAYHSKFAFAGISIAVLGSAMLVPVYAQVEVVEGQPAIVTEGDDSTYTPRVYTSERSAPAQSNQVYTAGAGSVNAELFVQLQALQAEVRELRGLVEQQSYTIEQLSQRRMDDYLDLDRRIAELSGGAPSNAVESGDAEPGAGVTPAATNTAAARNSYSTQSNNNPAPVPPAPLSAAKADEAKQAYRAAYQKVKDRQFDQARVSLVAFVKSHPDSHYVPNAHFWLGELYYLESDLDQSRDSFTALITGYPQHRKVADAKFKLGKVYHQQGDQDAARGMLESVLNDHPGSTAANPAREYLNNSLR